MLLTDVDRVYLDWGTLHQLKLDVVTTRSIGALCFASGSMELKVAAAIDFATGGRGVTVIGHLEDALEILERQASTVVVS